MRTAGATPGILLTLTLMFAGCAGDGPFSENSGENGSGGSGGADSFNALQSEILDPGCATSGCHNAATRAGGLDLSTAAKSYDALVDTASFCTGKLRVSAGDSGASYLLDKLGAGVEPCGSLMPLGSPALDDTAIARIAAWIDAGAPPPDNTGSAE